MSTVQIRVTDQEKRMWEAEAAIEGFPTLTAWIKDRCNEKKARHSFGDYAKARRAQLEKELSRMEGAVRLPPPPPFPAGIAPIPEDELKRMAAEFAAEEEARDRGVIIPISQFTPEQIAEAERPEEP